MMFNSMIKRLLAAALAFLILLSAFTFAFYIIHFGSESSTFGDLGKSFLKVFVMIHGEFEFEALWKDSADRLEKKPVVKVFTMLLLVGLCLSGSLIMVKEKVNLQTFPFCEKIM